MNDREVHASPALTEDRLVLGMLRIADRSPAEIRALVSTAREVGVTTIDHAAIYGATMHECEARFADAMRWSSAERAGLSIQSKAGIVGDGRYLDLSYDRIVTQVEGSLRALRTDYLDVLLLHRPDALVEPDEVARAFDHLEAAGKVRAFGVSNHTPRQIELLRTAVRQPLVVNQLQLSLTHAPIIAQGMAMNMAGLEQAVTLDGGGIVEYCRINGITIQAWSPFQSGFFTGSFLGAADRPDLTAALDRLGLRYGVPPAAIATAWLLRHPARMQVVLGTTTPQRVRDAALGLEIVLTRAEWYELFRAAGHPMP